MKESSLTYASYLRIDELLQLQQARSDGPEHDELLFIIIHQTYELWFKQLLHELTHAVDLMGCDRMHEALATLGRTRAIIKTLVGQVDILETMTPLQFTSFRGRLESSSGFQSAQFREFEAVLGRRDPSMVSGLLDGDPSRRRVEEAMSRPAVWDAVLGLLARRKYPIPADILERDVAKQWVPDGRVQDVLIEVYRTDAEASLLLEHLVDIDEGLQEWRYRHVKMVERTIGHKVGTGGSSGVAYLSSTLFRPCFPDLWDIRSRF